MKAFSDFRAISEQFQAGCGAQLRSPRIFKGPTLKSTDQPGRRGNTLKRFQGFYLKARTRIRPCMSYMCHIRSTEDCKATGLESNSSGSFLTCAIFARQWLQILVICPREGNTQFQNSLHRKAFKMCETPQPQPPNHTLSQARNAIPETGKVEETAAHGAGPQPQHLET